MYLGGCFVFNKSVDDNCVLEFYLVCMLHGERCPSTADFIMMN